MVSLLTLTSLYPPVSISSFSIHFFHLSPFTQYFSLFLTFFYLSLQTFFQPPLSFSLSFLPFSLSNHLSLSLSLSLSSLSTFFCPLYRFTPLISLYLPSPLSYLYYTLQYFPIPPSLTTSTTVSRSFLSVPISLNALFSPPFC